MVFEPGDGEDLAAVEAAVLDAGGRGLIWGGGWLQAEVDAAALPEIAAAVDVRWVRPPHRPSSTVESEGVPYLFEGAREDLGVDGAGIEVAILDVGFDGWDESEEIGAVGEVELRTTAETWSSAHGAAVAEVIHDIAPAAKLVFYDFSTDVEFLARLEEMEADGVELVNASIGFDNLYPQDGASPYAVGVDALADAGALYVAAAGNEGDKYVSGSLSSEGERVSIEGRSEILLYVRGGSVDARLRWSEPYGAAEVDLDLYVYDDDGDLCGVSDEHQGGDGIPLEMLECSASGAYAYAEIVLVSGAVDGLEAWLYSSYGLDEPVAETSLTLPADAAGALAVGAWYPETGELAAYSSHGPTEDGRLKPDLVAPTAVSTDTYGSGGFEGTSAAAPHVTGLAALLMERRGRARPEKIRGWLESQALDLGEVGPDDAFGHGAARLERLPCGCASGSAAPGRWAWSAWWLLALLLLRRRS